MNVNNRGVYCELRTHCKEICHDLLHQEAFDKNALNIGSYKWHSETDVQSFSTKCECVCDVITVEKISNN